MAKHRGEPTPTLDELLKQCWRMLAAGTRNAGHPFHTGLLGTSGRNGCVLRTVVSRATVPESRKLICHTAARSSKCEGQSRIRARAAC